jgi:molybdopterin-containing oxidoreductase family membrane subunit
MQQYMAYWADIIRCAFSGSGLYKRWMLILFALIIPGAIAYYQQLTQGMIVTNMSNQVSWGAYIANFTFLVGIAAAAVLLVFPAYVYGMKGIKKFSLVGEQMAMAAIIMCLLFVTVDLGRPDRFLHIMPFFGKLNFPASILAWDVVVLTGYLILNLHIPGYQMYQTYLGKPMVEKYFKPFIWLSIIWAISIHTVTAFLFSGLGGRPFWNSAILAPRFLVSAFAAGPALLLIIIAIMRKYAKADIDQSVDRWLKNIVTYTLPANVFLFGCEIFKEFYTGASHSISMEYLFFGIEGSGMLRPFIWFSLLANITASVMFIHPVWRNRMDLIYKACGLAIVGIWIEKGMGLIVPGFLPTPTGDLVEYTPSLQETLICLSIWAIGALVFMVATKVTLAVQNGDLRAKSG